MPIQGTIKGTTVEAKLWMPNTTVESEALDQVRKIASLPQVYGVSIMPDAHAGKGCVVGSVIAMKGAVSPAAVGVDIGCGMAAVKTNLKASDLPDDLKAIRSQIERDIPVGFDSHKYLTGFVKGFDLWDRFKELDPLVQGDLHKALHQCGTLGGGNHFIELCLDTDQNVWMMLHSGSRNIGKTLAEIHMARAAKLEHNKIIVDRDLSTFLAGTKEMEDYRRDLYWAQEFALVNRKVMLHLYEKALLRFFPQLKLEESVICHHNYVSEEKHFDEDLFVTRKGAIKAAKGDMGIIPGSMGTKSYIVRGLGNPDSFNSASHGAGRTMSRSKARKTFTEQDIKDQTYGVECRKDKSIVDELPGAYKSIEEVMKNQSDLVEIVYEIKQVLCVKG